MVILDVRKSGGEDESDVFVSDGLPGAERVTTATQLPPAAERHCTGPQQHH